VGMRIGGLSQKEMSLISDILEKEGVSYQLVEDDEIMKFNDLSMKNNLRHFNPPSISTHIMAIEIDDSSFFKLSTFAKEKLKEFGITDEIPEFPEPLEAAGNSPREEILHGNRRVVGMNLKHQLVVIIFALAIIWILRRLL
jgi:hypothetical protein